MSVEVVATAMGAGVYAKPLEDGCILYKIESTVEKCELLAQVAHESDGFATAQEYASGKAYEGRQDLGNTSPGDGTKYKGHGLIQVTGKDNHTAYSFWKYGDDRVVKDPTMLTRLPDAVDCVFWFWCVRKPSIRPLAQAGDTRGVTKKVNGGFNGLTDRIAKKEKAVALFNSIKAPKR